nr:TRAP transporter substrate-binding protein DctP [Pseudomonas sp.]
MASVMALLAMPAQAQEKIKLKFADWMPTSHYTVVHGAHPFMDKATELSKGRIEFQYFPSEQLGKAKDLLTLVQSGAADIVDISPSYISDKFALSSVAELPAMFTTACQGSYAYAELAAEGGILAEREFKPNRIRVLASIAYAPYKVATVGQKVETVKDFSGLKLRTAGGAMDLTATQLGAVSVRMPGPDILPSLSRRTLDGVLAPLQSVKVFDLQTELRHMTTDVSLGSFITVYAISERAWKALPEDMRKVLEEAGKHAQKTHCEYVDATEPQVIKQLEADGVVANSMAAGQLEALNTSLAEVGAQWAKSLDDRKRPGTDVLKAFQEAVATK